MLNIHVNSTELATLFGVSIRQIQRLTLDGVIAPISETRPYRYDLRTVCPQYCGFLNEKATNNTKADIISSLEAEKLTAEIEYKKARATSANMELKERQGKLHRAEDVEAITTDHVLYVRSMLLGMPGKLAMDLAGTHTAAEQAECVKKEVYWILNNLADYRYDPEEYAKRVRERQGWDTTGSPSE